MNTKFCKDCKWCAIKPFSTECEAPQSVTRTNLVTGEVTKLYTHCETHRSSDAGAPDQSCGETGYWFESKEAL